MTEPSRNRSYVSAQRVAERAGVSRSAVSRTFTDGASVSEATRIKVLKAAEELGYHVNHLARGLINEQSNIVCIVAADMAHPFQSRMLELLTDKLQILEKVSLVINTGGESESVSNALRQTLHYRADATVVLSGSPAISLIDTCLANGQNVILINRNEQFEGVKKVIVNNDAAGKEAFALLRRAGCKRLAIISSQAGTSSLVGREDAFLNAARAGGIEATVTRAGPTTYQSGIDAARLLLSRSERPDAAFCVTDLLALGFMDAARHEFGLSIPQDLCVVGFDDIEQAGWESYNLTTFKQPVEQMADHIVSLLTDVNALTPQEEIKVFEVQPVWRRSVRPR